MIKQRADEKTQWKKKKNRTNECRFWEQRVKFLCSNLWVMIKVKKFCKYITTTLIICVCTYICIQVFQLDVEIAVAPADELYLLAGFPRSLTLYGVSVLVVHLQIARSHSRSASTRSRQFPSAFNPFAFHALPLFCPLAPPLPLLPLLLRHP